MPSRSTRTTGIVLAIVGLVAVVIAIVLLVRPGGGAAAPGGSAGTSPSAGESAPASQGGPASAGPAPSGDASADPSVDPSVDPSAAPAPDASAPAGAAPDAPAVPAAAPAVDAFSASPSTVSCAGDRTAERPVSLSWSTSGGAAARLAIGTTDVRAGDPVELSSSGSGLSVACRDSETLVALTVEGADGSTAQRTLVITAED